MSHDPKKTDNSTLNITASGAIDYSFGTENFPIMGTSTTSILNLLSAKELVTARFIEKENGNFIEMIFRQKPNYTLTTSISTGTFSLPDFMIKETYGVVDGKLQLISTVNGTEKPGYYVEPTIEWQE